MKNFVKYFLIIFFSIAFLCQCFGQCAYESRDANATLTEYQTVFADKGRSVHLSLVQVGKDVALEVSYVISAKNEPSEICLDEWSHIRLILDNGPMILMPYIGYDTCSENYNQGKAYKRYATGLYELDAIQLALLERSKVDSMTLYFVSHITRVALLDQIYRSKRGSPIIYGKHDYNAKRYFMDAIACLKEDW